MGCSSAEKRPAALKKPVGKKVISKKPSTSTSQTTAKKPAIYVMPIIPNEGVQVLLNRSTALGVGDIYLRLVAVPRLVFFCLKALGVGKNLL